ncbi:MULTISPECIES: hypothetical protein [Flavobacterium]|uniref:hypothetical protein n=1 Tax=Flavobacterium TaxID=237 RepID=UPI0011834263|nr:MULTISPECIES: hypothetical protein [Flavobacterium]MCR4033134.1 hypothetical protein [Flavobacterium panacis]
MKNIIKINPFKSNIQHTDFGILTTLETEVEISTKDSIYHDNKSLLANYIYSVNGTYQLVYTIIDNEGNSESYLEEDGILPTLFLNPELENYVSIIPYNPDKELEISLPVFNRQNEDNPKGNKPFTGDFIGIANQYSIFYDSDTWSETKPDKILAIEFNGRTIKKKHNVKVPFPKNNKIFISNNEIHLLSIQDSFWLHRQIDEKGNILKERKIKSDGEYIDQILTLSFERTSSFFYQKEDKIGIVEIDSNNNLKYKDLLRFKDPFFNTWRPEKISRDTYVIRFNTEFGNGWLTLQNENIFDFFYSKEVNGYKNLITNEVLEMPTENLIISSINKTKENNFLIVFYPLTDRHIKNNKIITLNRELK